MMITMQTGGLTHMLSTLHSDKNLVVIVVKKYYWTNYASLVKSLTLKDVTFLLAKFVSATKTVTTLVDVTQIVMILYREARGGQSK
jgi:hypothetical protein